MSRLLGLLLLVSTIGVSYLLFLMYNETYTHLQIEPTKPVTSVKPLCTFALFRRYNAEHHYFPRGGKWTTTSGVSHYDPELCRFTHPRISRSTLGKCLMESRVHHVSLSGDSSGIRNQQAIWRSFGTNCKNVGAICIRNGVDRGAINEMKSTFGFLMIHMRKRCQLKPGIKNQTVYFEQILHIVMPLNATGIDALRPAQCYPDLFLIFMPFFHVKVEPLNTIRTRIRMFMRAIKRVVPQSAKIFYFNTYSEFESARRGKSLPFRGLRYDNMLAAEKILKMNDILYSELEKDLLNTSSKTYGFIDLFNVSSDRASWSTDGIHMIAKWHDTIMSMFWQTYCNSFYLNEF
ncbi:hypothetical protein LSH36_1121g00024 [Paralvinella palmiformis]|uniref:Uncharacterized protein n=1 Tax=Paralvinella palmiformis TaxID=53620 RepID=A0AAD9IVG9_9ANNE|nr:hypothetical protein LSH36_1121g00024 [Paralvinella palmiformis]